MYFLYMSDMIVTIKTDQSQFHKQRWLMSMVETKCVLCELGSEFLSVIEIHFLVKGLKCAFGAMLLLTSEYSFSTHLLVQKPDYIQDARYQGDLLLTKMSGAVRTA